LSDSTRASDRRLARYVRRDVYPFSAHYRALLDQAGVGPRVRGLGDLSRVPPTDLGELADPGSLVLRPDLRTIVRHGPRGLALRAVVAKAIGGMHRFNRRVVEDRYKPVHWMVADGLPLGCTSSDLRRLARLGEAWLERAGAGRRDVVVSLLQPGPSVAYWQLVLGCRWCGASAVHLGPAAEPESVVRLGPSVLAGEPERLVALLAAVRASGSRLANLRTVLAVGEPLSADARNRLRSLSEGAAVVGAWAPAGVRAVWSECRRGAQLPGPTGYHAWDGDVLELVSAWDGARSTGELLWTGVGWRGSALLRLRTYTTVALDRAPCPACGASQARIVPLAPVARQRGGPATEPVVAAGSPALADRAARVDGGAYPGEPWSPLASSPPVAEPVPVPVGSFTPDASRRDAPVAPAPSGAVVVATGSPPAPATPEHAEALLDEEIDVAAWQLEYRRLDGRSETIVVLAPAWGAAVVPLIRRLDRHLRATQFIVLGAEEVAARVAVAGGRRITGTGPM